MPLQYTCLESSEIISLLILSDQFIKHSNYNCVKLMNNTNMNDNIAAI